MKQYVRNEKTIERQTFPVIKWVTPNARVLEFGTATGYMTKYMKEALNCRITGVELNKEMAALTSPYTESMIVADVDKDAWELELKGTFDFIIFGDVLEHLRNPEKTIEKCLNFLSPGGALLTSIPNIGHSCIIMSLIDGEFEYNSYGLLDDTHIHFFTRKSIVKMMNTVGLTSADENDSTLRPGCTELKKFYINHPASYFSYFWRADAETYQFVNKWVLQHKETNSLNKRKGKKGWKYLFTFLHDINDYLLYKFNFQIKFRQNRN